MIIELRIKPGQFKISSIMTKVANECSLSPAKICTAPHLVVCDFEIDDADRAISVFENLGTKYCKGIDYVIDGFHRNDGDHTEIHFNILPSEDLVRLRGELVVGLRQADTVKQSQAGEESAFHIILCSNLSDDEADKIMTYIAEPPKDNPQYRPIGHFYFHFTAMRLALVGHDCRTICEYDLVQGKTLSHKEAAWEESWKKTFWLYRHKMGFEIDEVKHSKTPQTYLIGDLHLDHENIIRYCARPFVDVDEMNRVLVHNWNRIVGPSDTVYFLGDMTFGRRSRGALFWLEQLNGKIVFINGNHDRKVPNAVTHHVLEHKRHRFLLVHDPNELPVPWDGWMIHGDKHNNDMRHYPFVNKKKMTVNVSCEVKDTNLSILKT